MSLGEAPILIKKVKKVSGHGHHGGAWKVAYADFVTAMMAFFLLMWLINTTSPEQKKGIADYFAPASIAATNSGAGGILAGTALGDDGVKQNGSMAIIEELAPESPNPSRDGTSDEASLGSASDQELREALQRREEAELQMAAQSIRQSLQSMPELTELSKQIMVKVTPEGLEIELIDQDGRSMFENNSAQPNARIRTLLRAVAPMVNQMPNRVRVTGHTSMGAGGRTQENDWDLSSARARASRRLLEQFGVDSDRFDTVAGAANSDPLYPDDPQLAGNRRVTILLLRENPVLSPDHGL